VAGRELPSACRIRNTVCRRSQTPALRLATWEDLTRSAAASHYVGRANREANLLNKRLAETEAQQRAKALANAVYAECRSRCISDAGRRLVNTVLTALTEHEAATGRKYARRGKRVTDFATAVEGFIGDLMLARNNTAAGGWVSRPSITGTSPAQRSLAHISPLRLPA
jgi:hypothetical protein